MATSGAQPPASTSQGANQQPVPTLALGPWATAFAQVTIPAGGPRPQPPIHPVYNYPNFGHGKAGISGGSYHNHFSTRGPPRPVIGTMQVYNKQEVEDMTKENAELKKTIKGQSANLVGIQEASLEKNEKLASFMEPQSTVTFIAGIEHKPFVVHEHLLGSPFFKAAFGGKFKESLEGSINWEDVEVEVFHLLKYWLYTGEINFDTNAVSSDQLLYLANLWNLGQRCILPKLQNKVIHVLYNEFKKSQIVPLEVIYLAYDNEYRSALKRLIVFSWVNFASKETLRDFVDAFPDNLKKEVLIGLKDELPSRKITQEGTSVSQFYVEVDDNN